MAYSATEETKRRVRAPVPESVDVAVVGCGMGGLTAAAYLAKSGLKVACFDSHYVAGGCATMFSRGGDKERYNFDVGLHYIGDCGEDGQIPLLLKGLGIDQDYTTLDPDGFDVLIFPDFRFPIPTSKEVYRDRLVEHFPKEKKGIDRYIRFLNEVDAMAYMMTRGKARSGLQIGLHVALRGRLLARYQNATIAQFLDSCTQDVKLRAVILGQNGDYGIGPAQCSAFLHAGLVNHYFKGAYYPNGGGQVFADKISACIEADGGTVHLRAGVEKILVTDGKVQGIQLEGKEGRVVKAPVVISNADLKRTYADLLGPDVVDAERLEKMASSKMGGAIFMTYLGVTADMTSLGMGNANYWQFDGYDFDEMYDKNDALEEPQAFGAYITSASLKEPEWPHHAPTGVTNLEVMALVPGDAAKWGVEVDAIDPWKYKKSSHYQELKSRIEEELIQRLETVFPGSAETIVYKESATPVTHTRYTRASGGSGYGLAATPDQFLQKRHGYRGPAEGLYFAGASTRAGHGVVGAMMSGHQAAIRVGRDRGVEVNPVFRG